MIFLTLLAILSTTAPTGSSVSRRSSATFSYNQNRRHDFFHDDQDGSHGFNYQYSNPESNYPSHHTGRNHQTSQYNPGPNYDSQWSSSEPLLSFDRPRNVDPPVYTPNLSGDSKITIDHRSPWYNGGNRGLPGQGRPPHSKNPMVVEDTGGHVYTIPQFPLVDAKAASMKYSNQNNQELFRNLYATHPDIVRYVNPPAGPINVLGVPHNLRFENSFGSVNGFRPQEYEDNHKLPTPVVDLGVRKGSGYIDDSKKFSRIYDYHPHIHGYVNPEKNAPINVFGVPPNLRFPHPNGQVDGFRPPEVETNKFLEGPAEDQVQPIGDRPILLRVKDTSASISAHPSTVHLDKNSNRAIYQSSQSQQNDYVMRPDFNDFHNRQQQYRDSGHEPLLSASKQSEHVWIKPGDAFQVERPIEKSRNLNRPSTGNVYNPKQRLHALAVQQQQQLTEVNYAEKSKSKTELPVGDKKPLQESRPFAEYSQGPIRYAYPRVGDTDGLTREEHFKRYISPTTYRPPLFRSDVGSLSNNQNSDHQQRNDQQHARFSYEGPNKHSNFNGQQFKSQARHSGFSYSNSNDRPLNEPFRNSFSINNLHPGARYENRQLGQNQGGPMQNSGRTLPVNEASERQKNQEDTFPREIHFIYKRPPLDHSKIQTEINIKIQQRRINPELNKEYQNYDKDTRYYDSSYPIGDQFNSIKYDNTMNPHRTGSLRSFNQHHRDDNGTFRYSPSTEYASYQQAPNRQRARPNKGDTGDWESSNHHRQINKGRNNFDMGRGEQRQSYGNPEFFHPPSGKVQPQPRDSYRNTGNSFPVHQQHRPDIHGNNGGSNQNQLRDGGSYRQRDRNQGNSYASSSQNHQRQKGDSKDNRANYRNSGISPKSSPQYQPRHGDSYNKNQDYPRNTGISYSSSNHENPSSRGPYSGHGENYRNPAVYRPRHGDSYNGNRDSYRNAGISSNKYHARHGDSYSGYGDHYGNGHSAPYQYQPKVMHDYGNYDSYGYTNQGNNAGYGRDTYSGPSGDYGHHYGQSNYGYQSRPYDDYYHYKPKTILGHLLPKLIKYGLGLGLTKEITIHRPDYSYLDYVHPAYRRDSSYGQGYNQRHGYNNNQGYNNQGYNNHGYNNHGYTHPTKGITIRLSLNNLLTKALHFLQ